MTSSLLLGGAGLQGMETGTRRPGQNTVWKPITHDALQIDFICLCLLTTPAPPLAILSILFYRSLSLSLLSLIFCQFSTHFFFFTSLSISLLPPFPLFLFGLHHISLSFYISLLTFTLSLPFYPSLSLSLFHVLSFSLYLSHFSPQAFCL